MNRKKHQ